MAALDLTADFTAAPIGPMTTAGKQAVWGLPRSGVISFSDSDPNGNWFSLADDPTTGERYCRMFYPANQPGENSKFYQLKFGSLGVPVNVEHVFMFETGFDWTRNPGKIAPLICWGGRSGSSGGATIFATWGSTVGAQNKPFNPIVQNQQSPSSFPSEFVSPSFNTANIQANRRYKWRYQIMGGPNGWAKHWLDDVPLNTTVTTLGNTTPADSVMLEVGFWAGGTIANATDSWGRCYSMRVWTETPQMAITQAIITLS